VAAAIVALALFSTWPAPPLPVVQPTGLAAAAASNSAISIDWSGPKTGPRPGTYEIVEDGAVIGTAPGYITRYRRTGLSPATSYRFQVIAVRGATRSPASAAIIARTGTPSLSEAVFSDWTGTVRSRTTSIKLNVTSSFEPSDSPQPFGPTGKSSLDPWKINADCYSGQCGATVSGSLFGVGFMTDLSRGGTGTTYTGTADTGPVGTDFFSGCYNSPGISPNILSIRITVTHASPIAGRWGADKWGGSATLYFESSTTCAVYTINFALNSS